MRHKKRGARKGKRRAKRSKRSQRTALVSYQASPFPRIYKTNLVYVENNITISPTAGSIATEIYRATSVYDPDVAVGGHQPRYLDQIMPMYDHYVVMGAKINVTLHSKDNAIPGVVMLGLFDDGSPLSSANDYMENKHSRYKCMSTNWSGPPTYISSTYSPKFLGKKDPLDSDELKGTISTNPTENAYWHLVIAPMDAGDDLGNVTAIVRITYRVAFVEPNTVAQS